MCWPDEAIVFAAVYMYEVCCECLKSHLRIFLIIFPHLRLQKNVKYSDVRCFLEEFAQKTKSEIAITDFQSKLLDYTPLF